MKRNYDFSKAKRGPVLPAPPGKTRITIRIDDDVLDWFRKQVHDAGGGNYQTMLNRALREYMEGQVEPFEHTLRRVLSASTTLRHRFVEFSVQRLACRSPFRVAGAC